MKKKLIAIMLILSIIIPLIPTNIVISSAASDTDKYKTWDKMTFSTSSSSSTGNKVAVVSQMVGWHYSGGYWKFTAYGSTSSIEIRDKQMTDIMEGYLESEALSKYIEVEADLPSNIKTYLKNSGSIENINISFDSGKMDPDKIYDGTIYYTINKTKEKIIIAFKPKFNVSGEPIYDKIVNGKKTGMNIEIPQGMPGYGSYQFYRWTPGSNPIAISGASGIANGSAVVFYEPTSKDLNNYVFWRVTNDDGITIENAGVYVNFIKGSPI